MHYRKQVKEEIKGLVIDSCKSVGGEVGSRHNKQDSESSEHRELKVPMMVVYIWPLSLPLLTTRYRGLQPSKDFVYRIFTSISSKFYNFHPRTGATSTQSAMKVKNNVLPVVL